MNNDDNLNTIITQINSSVLTALNLLPASTYCAMNVKLFTTINDPKCQMTTRPVA